MPYQNIIYHQEEAVAWITLNRPEKLNALSDDMMEELKDAFEKMAQDRTVSVCVLRGSGRAFCSGRDLGYLTNRIRKEKPQEDVSGVLYAEHWRHQFGMTRQCAELLWRSPLVYIAQIHGYCVGAGWELATFCDLIVAAEDARVVWRPTGGSGLLAHLWPWTIGLRKTKEILFSGEYVTGKEAQQMGMINKSVPSQSLEHEVDSLARKVARRPREFLYLDKIATNKAFEMMGLWNAWDYAIAAHITSHLTESGREMADGFANKSTNEVKEMLSKKVSPYTKKENK
ncbi:enoyl-CoA hydratase/isomerase family protein [Chloroflexota bacterium]